MNRFEKKKKQHPALRAAALPAAFFAALLAFLGAGVSSVSRTAEAEHQKATYHAIARAAAHAYAVSGAYPPSLEELEARYGLQLDREKYIIDYRCFAANVMPDITVLPKEGEV